MYKTIDLFCGIGGIRKGFELTNKFNNVLSAEIDKYACETYKHLYGDNPYNDVTSNEFKEKVENIDYDVLLGGFPCQPFSISGVKKGFKDKTRGTLFFDIADILDRTKPKAFLLENVEGLYRHNKGNTFKIIIETLDKLNYKISGVNKLENGTFQYDFKSIIRETINFGLPQKRKRTYIIGFRKDIIPNDYILDDMPINNDKIIFNSVYDILDDEVLSKYYLAQGYLDSLDKHKNRHKTKGNGFGYKIVNVGDNPISNTLLALGGSGKERNLIKQYREEYDGLILKSKKTPLNDKGIRTMTSTEWARLQGFKDYAFIKDNKDTFSFPSNVSETQQYKQLGNSVSIPVIEELAYYIYHKLKLFDIYNKYKYRKYNYTNIELFAGGGGLSLGLEKSGFRSLLLVENDKYSVSTLRENRPSWNVIEEDIENVYKNGIKSYLDNKEKDIDLLSGGFPCQSFSYSGKKLGLNDRRGTLYYFYAKILQSIKPKVFLVENVKGLYTHDNGNTFKIMKDSFEENGYIVYSKILNSFDYNVAQKRERLIVIGIRDDIHKLLGKYEFPLPNKKRIVLKDILKDVPKSKYYQYSEKKKKIFNFIKEGENWRSLSNTRLKRYFGNIEFISSEKRSGNHGVLRRLSFEKPAPTILCSPSQRRTERCHPIEARPLTIRESARIQSFPDNWKFMGSISNQYKQIGNAVPVNLSKAIGLSIKAYLDKLDKI